MTKIYCVMRHFYDENSDIVDEVFTNKKKAVAYKEWRNTDTEKGISYIIERTINNSNYSELLKAGI